MISKINEIGRPKKRVTNQIKEITQQILCKSQVSRNVQLFFSERTSNLGTTKNSENINDSKIKKAKIKIVGR